MQQQLQREVNIMQKIDHPNVCKLYHVMQTSRKIYLIMELISGGELFLRVQKQKYLPESEARYFFQQLICGVFHVHSHGIAHRDLKLENILILGGKSESEPGKPMAVEDLPTLKITDFGLSNLQNKDERGEVTRTLWLQTMCGTPQYVAPEVLTGSGYNGFSSDVWSCGVMLFAMLAGRLPFYSPNRKELFEKIKSADFQMSSKIGPEAAALITRILEPSPDKRLSVEDIILTPWFQEDIPPHIFRQFEGVLSKTQVRRSWSLNAEPTQYPSPSDEDAGEDLPTVPDERQGKDSYDRRKTSKPTPVVDAVAGAGNRSPSGDAAALPPAQRPAVLSAVSPQGGVSPQHQPSRSSPSSPTPPLPLVGDGSPSGRRRLSGQEAPSEPPAGVSPRSPDVLDHNAVDPVFDGKDAANKLPAI
eukprot:NODE_1184_length_1535_cov_13.947510_g982_i0.p1 GENE.NODE_1184_length_1535_cov_13.947510_g982_i0~~NODE_1184_length_1535_cov_13.947510_g982_i0.p1  ORF type:complete len:470 (+),score=107.43 NODE_1184_length_1535_cov_13.947510_g982_i0:160-1410(+)